MAITFHCPNGHKLSAGEEQVGKAVKCPTCETAFRVPAWSDQVESSSGNGIERALATASAKLVHREKASTIVFLCPNGHRLNSPASLAGRPGKCPHCGIKFLVPSHEGPSDVPSSTGGLSDRATADEGGPAPTQPVESTETSPPVQELVVELEVVNSSVVEDELPMIDMEEVIEAAGTAMGSHPMAEIMVALWSYRAPGTVVEVRLADGEVLVPDGYAQDLSRRSHCLLAVRQPDGTHTLTAVAWDAIARVSVRGVKALRADTFEE